MPGVAFSFAEVVARFANGNVPHGLSCMAMPYGSQCPNNIEHDHLLDVPYILNQALGPLELDEVRNVINCLLCASHQQNSYWKQAADDRWEAEFPHLTFDRTRRRSNSPYSLSRGKTSPRPRRTASQSTTSPAGIGRPAASTRHSDSRLMPHPPLTHSEFRPRSQRSASAPQAPVIPTVELSDHASPGTPSRRLSAPGSESEQSEEDSPSAARGRRQDTARLSDRLQAIAEDVVRPDPIPSHNDDSTIGEARDDTPLSVAEIDRPSSEEPEGFVNGDASSWAPWTIRDGVRSLVLEPLPRPNEKGSIYVVQNLARTHVKIGITQQSFRTRLRQIANQHQQELDITNAWHLPSIPYMQLSRLEDLVHADLAYYQRNLRVRTDRSFRTHREWFEVQMPVAVKTVRMWWDIMQRNRLQPGEQLDETTEQTLISNSAFDVDMDEGDDEAVAWAEKNADHDLRIGIWTGILLSDPARRSSTRSRTVIWWIVGCIFVWILPDMLELPGKAGFPTQAVLLSLWSRHAFAAV